MRKPWLGANWCTWQLLGWCDGHGYLFIPYLNKHTTDVDLVRGDGLVTDMMRLRIAC